MTRTLIPLTALLCLLSAVSAHADDSVRARAILGYVERITLEPTGVEIPARLDTGAKTSSLHSADAEEFQRDGEQWLRFTVPLEEQTLEFERPLERVVLIKRKGAESQRRYVVSLPFCLNGQRYEAEFSLTDRSGFLYPALLGRTVLKDVTVVDPAVRFLATESCASAPEVEASEAAMDAEEPAEADTDTGEQE